MRGGGRKPFAQKGSGNARQGSRTSPLKPGGGVVFGPKVSRISAEHPAVGLHLAAGVAVEAQRCLCLACIVKPVWGEAMLISSVAVLL